MKKQGKFQSLVILVLLLARFSFGCQPPVDLVELPNEPTAFEIIAVHPEHGAAGDRVTIEGIGFQKEEVANTVLFNGTAAAVEQANENYLEVIVPKGGSTGNIVVVVNGTEVEGPVFIYE